MSAEAKAPLHPCPKCGVPFDPARDEILECPQCGCEGATACCNTGGRNCLCNDCDIAADEDDSAD